MGEVINLNQFRKAKEKADARKTASANRTRYGRTKEERDRTRDDNERDRTSLDGKLLEDKSGPKDAPDAK